MKIKARNPIFNKLTEYYSNRSAVPYVKHRKFSYSRLITHKEYGICEWDGLRICLKRK